MEHTLLDTFVSKMDAHRFCIHGITVLQNGNTVAQHRWRRDDRENLYSASKSFVSIAIGMAIDEGLLSLTDLAADFFGDRIPAGADPRYSLITIRDLLTMASGHAEGFLFANQPHTYIEKDWVRYFFSQPLTYEPGSHFTYNNGCTYLLSAILTARTGQTVRDFLLPRLFDVLGIGNPQWFCCPMGVNTGGNGLFLTTDELARFGQMLLDGGVYGGKRLISKQYLDLATASQIETDADGDYGFQFWMCREPNSYMASGKYDQLCIVVPERNAVVSITAHVEQDNKIVHDALWEDVIAKL